MKKDCDKKEKIKKRLRENFMLVIGRFFLLSSNVNEATTAVLNLFILFYFILFLTRKFYTHKKA